MIELKLTTRDGKEYMAACAVPKQLAASHGPMSIYSVLGSPVEGLIRDLAKAISADDKQWFFRFGEGA